MQYLSHIGFFKASASSPSSFSFGNALLFDGTNDKVTTGNVNIGGSSTTAFTLSWWMKTVSVSAGVIGYPIASGNSSTKRFIVQDRQTQELRINFNADSIIFNNATPDTNWHHYFLVYNGTEVNYNDRAKLWRDGVSIGGYSSTSSVPTSLDTNTLSDFLLGVIPSAAATVLRYFNGQLDEVALWVNHAGTATDAVNLYNSGNGALATDVIASPERYYRLDESGTATTTVDASGNGNTGTLTGFTVPGYWVTH